MHPKRKSRGRRRPQPAFLLLLLLVLFLAGGAPVLAYAATPSVLEAPPRTAEMWIDVESDAARTALTSISWRAGSGPWTEADISRTVFGRTAVAQVSEGIHEVRFSTASRFSADIVISFADSSGAVLSDHRLREASLDPSRTPDSWISWSGLVNGPGNGGDTPAPIPDTDTSSPAAGSEIQHRDEILDPAPRALGQTGTSGALLTLVLGVAAVTAGTGILLARRRKRAGLLDESRDGR